MNRHAQRILATVKEAMMTMTPDQRLEFISAIAAYAAKLDEAPPNDL